MSTTFQVIGQEWRARSRDLAEWALEHLVNRRDVWGQYTSMTAQERLASKRGYKALTLPQKKMRGRDMVTLDKLTRHFGSLQRNHLIGLHATSPDNTSRWLAVDIDLHEPDAVDAEDGMRRNFAAAIAWWERAGQLGYDPLLLDSNGAGGYHLWILFAEPAPTADVFAFGQALTADWGARNLDAAPETFPKSAQVSGDKLGAWLRLPGLHHTREHFTRLWSGDPWLDEPWLEGDAAIELLLEARGGPPPPPSGTAESGEEKAAATKAKKKAPAGRRTRRAFTPPAPKPGEPLPRPTVCVDLDGVLAHYDGWRGVEHIGQPVDGAIEFCRALSAFADVLVYTTRCGSRPGRGGQPAASAKHDPAAVRTKVRAWLDGFGFTYADVHCGPGKPMASAYIDDRAVPCQPQPEGPAAFAAAERRARELCSRPVASAPEPGGYADPLAEICAAWPTLPEAARREILDRARGDGP